MGTRISLTASFTFKRHWDGSFVPAMKNIYSGSERIPFGGKIRLGGRNAPPSICKFKISRFADKMAAKKALHYILVTRTPKNETPSKNKF